MTEAPGPCAVHGVNKLMFLCSGLFGVVSLGGRARLSKRSLRSHLRGRKMQKASSQKGSLCTDRPTEQRWALGAIVVLFIALGTLYSVVTPLFETPDEVWHYLYVKYIADGRGLPIYHEGVQFPMHQEASQPPLYYLLNGWITSWIDTSDVDDVVRYNPHAAIGALSVRGNRNVISHTPYEDLPYRGTVLAAHLTRLLSVLMGAGTVICTYAIARRLFPEPGWVAPAAAALNALVPQFIFINASTNNDVLITLLAGLSLWLLVCIAQDGPAPARMAALGTALGLAALSKLNGLVLLPMAGIVLAMLAWRRRHRQALVGWSVWTFGAAALVGTWWYWRNWLLYGDPFGLRLMFAVLPQRAQRPTFPELLQLMDGALKSFFGVFGWFNIAMEPWLYNVFFAGLVLALVGLARFVYLLARQNRWPELRRVGLLGFWSTTFVLALIGWTQARYPQGRLLFPAMPAIAILLVLGLAQWLPRNARPVGVAGLLAALLVLSVAVPFRYIAPAYARAQPLTDTEQVSSIEPLSVEFGEKVRLVGFALNEATIRPGEDLWLTLYWEGLTVMERDYSVFVHLVDEHEVIVAQHDSYPGAGNDPTRSWDPGKVLRDVHRLDVPATLLAKGPLHLYLGLYDYHTDRRLAIFDPGGRVRDFTELPVDLSFEQQSAAELIEQDLDFAGLIALTGYSVEPIIAQPGDTLRMVLRWQALQGVDDDYTVFVQLMREGAQIWAQNDHSPKQGAAPTSTWAAGDVTIDEFDLHISPDAPADTYDLTIGLYIPATMKRLKLPDGTDFVVLGRVAVRRE